MAAATLSMLCTVAAFMLAKGGDNLTAGIFTVLAVIFLLAAADSTGDTR